MPSHSQSHLRTPCITLISASVRRRKEGTESRGGKEKEKVWLLLTVAVVLPEWLGGQPKLTLSSLPPSLPVIPSVTLASPACAAASGTLPQPGISGLLVTLRELLLEVFECFKVMASEWFVFPHFPLIPSLRLPASEKFKSEDEKFSESVKEPPVCC